MTAAVIANLTAPVGIVLIDPTTGLPYTATGGGGGGGGGTLPGYLAYASPAGAQNNVSPGGAFPTSIGRLDVTLGSGAANWTGLLAGTDGQILVIGNVDATNTLILNALNVGSSAANQFRYSADLIITPSTSILLVYYAGTVNKWVIT
jgi:hypothetical protein